MKKNKPYLFALLTVCLPVMLFAQEETNLNLFELQRKGQLVAVNRTITAVEEGGKKFIRVSELDDEGLVWLPVKAFSSGRIEIFMRGKDVLQKSFVGIVFHGLNDSTYDAVYCRPFNFFAEDSVRRIHAIEYIAHPTYTWEKLRTEFNAKYEKEIKDPPDPNGWFRMTLIIEGKTVKAFINDKQEPSLVVEKLSQQQFGKVGIFTGSGSGGDFEKINIRYNAK
ncbi:MAG TPA: hypothetical protein VFX73_05195 [Chitinophagaceae bacterium]|nr:hypothetical protein [Chitinophagaceae bacterium]